MAKIVICISGTTYKHILERATRDGKTIGHTCRDIVIAAIEHELATQATPTTAVET